MFDKESTNNKYLFSVSNIFMCYFTLIFFVFLNMVTLNLNLYDISRLKLNLTEADAKDFALVIVK